AGQNLSPLDGLREKKRERLGRPRDARDSEHESRQGHHEKDQIEQAQRDPRETLESDLTALCETEVREAKHDRGEERGKQKEPARLERAAVFLARDDADPAKRSVRGGNHRCPSIKWEPETVIRPAGAPSTSQGKSSPGRSARSSRRTVSPGAMR